MIVPGMTCVGNRPPQGFHGCKTYVRGYGLDNFCANGGASGFGCCSHNGEWRVCGDLDYETQRKNQPSGGWVQGTASANFKNCGDHEFNCGFSMFAPNAEADSGESANGQSWPGALKTQPRWRNKCQWDQFDDGYYNRKYGIGFGNTFGSNCQRVNINQFGWTPCYGGTVYRGASGQGYCAMWFGGDGGHHGLPGMMGSPCNHDAGNMCMLREYIPFPAGLLNDRGGYMVMRVNTQGCHNEWGCKMTGGMGYGANMTTDMEQNPIPGLGGWTAMNYSGDTCRCGYAGASGQIQITYYT